MRHLKLQFVTCRNQAWGATPVPLPVYTPQTWPFVASWAVVLTCPSSKFLTHLQYKQSLITLEEQFFLLGCLPLHWPFIIYGDVKVLWRTSDTNTLSVKWTVIGPKSTITGRFLVKPEYRDKRRCTSFTFLSEHLNYNIVKGYYNFFVQWHQN